VHRATRLSPERKLTLHLFIDAASIEAFADGAHLTDTFFPTRPFREVAVYAQARPCACSEVTHGLRSIWNADR
jgi:sucrose-6-phosphate hydrolase SacC (GH32 family)